MTTFNITRSNDQANSNLLLVGVAIVAIIAAAIAFAPALFSSSTVAVEGAPFGNGSNDGNFTIVTGDGRIEGTSPNLAIYPNGDVENFASSDIVAPSFSMNAACDPNFVEPSPLDAAGNYVYSDADGILIAYSSSAHAIIVREKDVEFYLDLADCSWGKFLIPS